MRPARGSEGVALTSRKPDGHGEAAKAASRRTSQTSGRSAVPDASKGSVSMDAHTTVMSPLAGGATRRAATIAASCDRPPGAAVGPCEHAALAPATDPPQPPSDPGSRTTRRGVSHSPASRPGARQRSPRPATATMRGVSGRAITLHSRRTATHHSRRVLPADSHRQPQRRSRRRPGRRATASNVVFRSAACAQHARMPRRCLARRLVARATPTAEPRYDRGWKVL